MSESMSLSNDPREGAGTLEKGEEKVNVRYSADLNGGFGKVYAHDGDPRPLPTSLIDQTATLVWRF